MMGVEVMASSLLILTAMSDATLRAEVGTGG